MSTESWDTWSYYAITAQCLWREIARRWWHPHPRPVRVCYFERFMFSSSRWRLAQNFAVACCCCPFKISLLSGSRISLSPHNPNKPSCRLFLQQPWAFSSLNIITYVIDWIPFESHGHWIEFLYWTCWLSFKPANLLFTRGSLLPRLRLVKRTAGESRWQSYWTDIHLTDRYSKFRMPGL